VPSRSFVFRTDACCLSLSHNIDSLIARNETQTANQNSMRFPSAFEHSGARQRNSLPRRLASVRLSVVLDLVSAC